MFFDSISAIYEHLDGLRGADAMLEGVKKTVLGDWEEIPVQHHPAVTVDGPEDISWRHNDNHLDIEWDIGVQLYTINPKNSALALETALDLYWRDTVDGPRGLLPALMQIGCIGPTPTNHKYLIRVNPRPLRGFSKQADGSWLCLIATLLTVKHKRDPRRALG